MDHVSRNHAPFGIIYGS